VKPRQAHVWRIDLDDQSWDAARVVLLHAGDVARIVEDLRRLAPKYYAYNLTAFAGHAACLALPVETASIRTVAAEAGRLPNARPAP
jgi:hypothetical protein